MRIARHHVPGTPEHKLSSMLGGNPGYGPQCPWPKDCMVQWGHGIAPAVPFFEAFPTGTFIRGEGKTIADAERQAYDQYLRDIACDHVWGRHRPGSNTYRNGAAFCRKCGGFRARMFPEIREFGWWRKALSGSERWYLTSLEEDAGMTVLMDQKYPAERDQRRRSARVLRLRLNVFGVDDRQSDWL